MTEYGKLSLHRKANLSFFFFLLQPKEREVVIEHTSSGSDWSDVDDVSTVRFSQEEPISLKLSAVPEPSAFPADFGI